MMNTVTAPDSMIHGSNRKTAVVVGVLFLTSTVTFAVGSAFITAFFSAGNPTLFTLVAGVSLEVYTGLAVAGIGLAMLPLLTPHSFRLANAYLVLRVLECLAIVTVGAYMLATRQQVENDVVYIYLFTAIGGVVFAYLLFVSGLIPRLLAGLGMVGYVVLFLGVVTSVLGLTDLSAGWGTVFFVPGGLFELILPFLLFARGFRTARTQLRSRRP